MRKRMLAFCAVVGLLPVAATTLAAPGPGDETAVIWTLQGTRVVDAGRIEEIAADPGSGQPGGVLLSGFVLEARATSRGKTVPEGTFRLTLSAFKPAAAAPGQDPSLWDVQGRWTIVDRNATKDALKARHNPYTVAGKLHASLPFNPAGERRNWSAQATVPATPVAGTWGRGSHGTLSLDAAREGDLLLVLNRLPRAR